MTGGAMVEGGRRHLTTSPRDDAAAAIVDAARLIAGAERPGYVVPAAAAMRALAEALAQSFHERNR